MILELWRSCLRPQTMQLRGEGSSCGPVQQHSSSMVCLLHS
jgi:hypothetical protein